MKTASKISYKEIQYLKKLRYFIGEYKNELEDLMSFIDKKLGNLDEKEEDLKIFINKLEEIYSKNGQSDELDQYYYDRYDNVGLVQDKKLINYFKRIIGVENKLRK